MIDPLVVVLECFAINAAKDVPTLGLLGDATLELSNNRKLAQLFIGTQVDVERVLKEFFEIE